MDDLHDILWNTTNDDLNYRVKLLAVKPRSARKADLIDAIKSCLEGGSLRVVWSSLDELEQAAVAEACYAPDMIHDEARFQARYGDLPSFCDLPEEKRNYGFYHWDSQFATRLNLLLFLVPRGRSRGVPFDLALSLHKFVPKPAEPTVPTMEAPAEEEGLYLRHTEHAALSDVMALLRLAEQGNLRISAKTGMVPATGRDKILACLCDGDFFPPDVADPPGKDQYDQKIGAIKPIGWARMLQAGRYFTCPSTKSKLTPAGIKALSRSAHQIIRHLWEKWLSNTVYDEFNRIDDIKGQRAKGHMTAKPPRRETIADALMECPANKWINLDELSKHMVATGQVFEVSRNHWKLYLCDAQYGSLGYDGYGGWDIVEHRYIQCLLFEYAATLGVVDIAYVHPRNGPNDFSGNWGADDLEWLSRYDGLRSFRITNLGAYCLGITDEFESTQPSSSLGLTVLPNLTIRIRSGIPLAAEQLLLETWAESIDNGTWRLDQSRGRDAVERGQKTADFIAFLERSESQPLPETVEGFFKTCESDGNALRSLGEAMLFECRDADTTEMIVTQAKLKGMCFRCGETQLSVPADNVPKFRKVVRSLGLGVT